MYTLQTAINEFINHCKYEKHLSSKTIKAYGIDLRQVLVLFTKKNYSLIVEDITKLELREFIESISSLSPKSIKRKLAVLKSLFNYLEFEDRIRSNPLRKMRINIKQHKILPKVMDICEISKIFASAYLNNTTIKDHRSYRYLESIRNIVVLELLFATGARVSEISNLRNTDIDLTTGTVSILGKGNKERIIQICTFETINILRIYNQLFANQIIESGGYFLINRLGGKLSDQSIRQIVKQYSSKANLTKNITPHVFRHSFATLLLEKDVDIKYIQLLLGHSSIMTTQIYTHVNREKQRQILNTKHPRKDFSMLLSLAP